MTTWMAIPSLREDGGINVDAFADGVRVYGWGLKSSHNALAQRLCRAVEAGAVFERKGSYWECKVLGRTMSADLRRLGY